MRSRALKRCYGLSQGAYDAMLDGQGGGCALCGQKCKSGRSLAVDHCHTTGTVRGLLCGNCNRGLGMFQDDPELMRRAASNVQNVPTHG